MFVVAGVSGNTGKVVAEALLAQKKQVRVIVRDAAKGAAWEAKGAEVAVAEADDAAALTQALKGAEAAYFLLPPHWASTDVRRDNRARAEKFAAAVKANAVKHVVLLSSVGAQHAGGTGPIATLHDAEATLAATGAALTVVRAAYFMENWGQSLYALADGVLPTFLAKDLVFPMVATDDIGKVAARALLEGGKGTTIIELSGPKDLSPDDVAAALGGLLGKPIAVQQGPEEAMVAALIGAGLPPHWAQLYKEMTHGVNSGLIAWEGGSARAVRGSTDLETVLRRLLPKA